MIDRDALITYLDSAYPGVMAHHAAVADRILALDEPEPEPDPEPNYYVDRAEEAMRDGDIDRAQVWALLAIADEIRAARGSR